MHRKRKSKFAGFRNNKTDIEEKEEISFEKKEK